jgi:hypothetical protein
MEQTTFTKRNNAKRAAERMIAKGDAPSIDYKLHEREDGRIEIVWKTVAATTSASWPDPNRLDPFTVEEMLNAPDELVSEPQVTEDHDNSGAEDNGFGPDPWPPGARVQVALGKRRIRMGTVDYQIDHKYWRVVLDGAVGGVSGMYRGDQLSAPGDDAPAPLPRARAKKERAAGAATKRTSKSAELDAAAARGVMPEKPICTSPANKDQYQKRFDFLAERATAGDWEAVRAYEVKGVNSYAKMVKRYRERLLTAHEAQQASEAA